MISIARSIIKRTTNFLALIAMLLIPALSEARVISVQMSAPTIAFGGYSWAGVGQYEKIKYAILPLAVLPGCPGPACNCESPISTMIAFLESLGSTSA